MAARGGPQFGATAELHGSPGTADGCSKFRLERDDALVERLRTEADESSDDEYDRLESERFGTVIALRGDRTGALLTISGAGTTLAPVPITYDDVYTLRLLEDGDDVVVVYTSGDQLLSTRVELSSGKVVRPQRVAAAELPECKGRPRITDALMHEGRAYVAVKAHAMGEHGLCQGYTEHNSELSALVIIAADGAATPPMMHPRRDHEARLGLVDGEVVGVQAPDVGFRVRCTAG